MDLLHINLQPAVAIAGFGLVLLVSMRVAERHARRRRALRSQRVAKALREHHHGDPE